MNTTPTQAPIIAACAVTDQYDFCNATENGEKLLSVRGGMPLFVVKHVLAANESTFMPSVANDAAFLRWAQRTTMRILNCESTDVAVRSAICAEGRPSTEWAQGLSFLGTIAN